MFVKHSESLLSFQQATDAIHLTAYRSGSILAEA